LSRPMKKGVDYFPHACTHGQTMFILEQRWGNDGYAFWFKLLELLGSTEGHVLDAENTATREFLAAKTRLSVEQCYEILNLLADLDAIDQELWKKHHVIWCQNFVDNLEPVYRKRKTETPTKPSFRDENSSIDDISVTESTQSKVKESKVDKTREKDNNKTHAQAHASVSAQKAQRTKFVKDLFENQFWKLYPRKRAKQDALKAFMTLFPPSASKEKCNRRWKNIVLHIDALVAEGRPPDKIPYPATFLRRENFDEPPAEMTTSDVPEMEFVEVGSENGD
jgi:hypothetical protein